VLTRREALVRGSSLGIVGTTATVIGYGGLRAARDLRVRELEVHIPGLPTALEGLSIVQLTDIHVGIFTGTRDFGAVIERVRTLRPDLVVLTGDLLDNNPAHVPDAVRLFSQLRGRLGAYGILGNHDYYADHEAVVAGLRAAGITPLVNEGELISSGRRGEGLALLGVDDVWAARMLPGRGPDLGRALRFVPPDAPRVLLAHNPVVFSRAAGQVALQLSGHTHGGQINPGNIARLALPFVSGRYTRDGSTLFVSNGLGLTGPPVRLAAPPEIVRIGLTGRSRG
jgi:predicted MPP superfamily phosphohydrolase